MKGKMCIRDSCTVVLSGTFNSIRFASSSLPIPVSPLIAETIDAGSDFCITGIDYLVYD